MTRQAGERKTMMYADQNVSHIFIAVVIETTGVHGNFALFVCSELKPLANAFYTVL